MNEFQKEIRYGPVVALVASRSKPGKAYAVRKKEGAYSCQCSSFIFSKSRPKTCKHIDGVTARYTDGVAPVKTPSKDKVLEDVKQIIASHLIGSTWTVAEKIAKDIIAYMGLLPSVERETPATAPGVIRNIILED